MEQMKTGEINRMGYEVVKVAEGIWMIQDSTVRMFLLDGGTESFLLS